MECDAFMKNVEKAIQEKPTVFEKLNSPSVNTYARKPLRSKHSDDKNILSVDVSTSEEYADTCINIFYSTFNDKYWTINGVFRKNKDCGYHASDALITHLPKAYEYAKKHNMPFSIPKVIIEDDIGNKEAKHACYKMAKHKDKERFNEEFSKTPLGKMEQHLADACGFEITERYIFTNAESDFCVATHVEFRGEV